MPTGLENELLNDSTVDAALPSEEETQEERLYTVVWGEKLDGDNRPGEQHSAEMTLEELEAHFNDDHKGSVQLRNSFGTFENYLSYMNAREDIRDELDVDNWADKQAAAREQIDAKYWEIAQCTVSAQCEVSAEDNEWMQAYAEGNQEVLMESWAEWRDHEAFAALDEEYGLSNYTDEKGRHYTWNGTGYIKTSEPDGFNLIGTLMKVGSGIAFGIASGGAASGALSGALGSTLGGAVSGAIGSAVGQAVTTGGDIDADTLLVAALTGGISGLAGSMIEGSLSGTMLDEAVWDMADLLNTDYAGAMNILEGVANGAVTGGDLESIALGAVGGIANTQAQNLLQDYFGDTVVVDDWFKDGASNIPTEALYPIAETVIQAGLEGGLSADDAVKALFDYFGAGGDVDFALPPGLADYISDIPGIDFEKGGWGIGFDEESNDWVINHDIPSIDLGEGPEFDIDINTPYNCTEDELKQGWTWDNLIGDCIPPGGIDVDVETPYNCTEDELKQGWTWDNLLMDCLPPVGTPDTPDIIECMKGFEWSDLYGKCVPKINDDVDDVIECMSGFEWSDLYGKCVPKINDDVDDVIECMSGFEWSDLYGKCVEKINDDTKGPQTPNTPEVPEIPDPELPDPEEVESLENPFTASWNWNPEYTTINTPQVSKYAPKKGMF